MRDMSHLMQPNVSDTSCFSFEGVVLHNMDDTRDEPHDARDAHTATASTRVLHELRHERAREQTFKTDRERTKARGEDRKSANKRKLQSLRAQ